jgi:pSer/pThr/pTyr-binding forkhead associated (FHA) protein
MVDTEGARLVVLRGNSAGKSFAITEGKNLVGRWDPETGAFPEVDLEAEDVDAKVSRKHAVIDRQGSACFIEDAGSLNGTYINRGPRLKAGERVALKSGDEVVIGKTFLRFEMNESP